MQNKAVEQEKFGLGELPPDASNTLSLDPSFTKKDFEEALKKVFPLSQALLDDQESLET